MRLAAVVARVPGVSESELADWVERGWVLPQGAAPDWTFTEIDVARVVLLRDLRHLLGVEEESVALVLSLVDQVYDLRRCLRAVMEAAADLPSPGADRLLEALRSRLG